MSSYASLRADVQTLREEIRVIADVVRQMAICSDEQGSVMSLMKPCGDGERYENYGYLRTILLHTDSKWSDSTDGPTRMEMLNDPNLPHGVVLKCDGWGVNETIMTDSEDESARGAWGRLKLIPVVESDGTPVVVSGWAW